MDEILSPDERSDLEAVVRNLAHNYPDDVVMDCDCFDVGPEVEFRPVNVRGGGQIWIPRNPGWTYLGK
jgi:hypothetical protein